MHSYVNLFAGAGGFNIGAQKAGLNPRFVTDINVDCIETIRASQGYLSSFRTKAAITRVEDIRVLLAGQILADRNYDIVIGGPPCHGDIVAGKVDPDDPGCELVFRFMDAVAQARPAGFIMENVPLLASPAWSLVMDRLRSQADKLGYDTYVYVLDAQYYGLAQARKRLFLFGVLKGCAPVTRPAYNLSSMGLNPARYVISSYTTHEHYYNFHPGSKITLARNPVLRSSPYAGQLLNGGRVFDLNKPAPAIVASMGGNLTPVYDVNQLRHGAEPWIVGYHRDLMDGEHPLSEIPAHVRMRRLSFREAAALQNFPSNYPFHGSPKSCWRQVGNAVPPLLGEVVVEALLASLS